MLDENLLVFDGIILWYFDFFVEQVILYCVEEVLEQMFFVLLICNKVSDWDVYYVEEKGDVFILMFIVLDLN